MDNSHILCFDHGTTEIKVCIVDQAGSLTSMNSQPIPQIYPQPGWVEQDANILWKLTLSTAEKALSDGGLSWDNIAAIAITNQRESAILWDPHSGNPLYHVIVWQCRRTKNICEQLIKEDLNGFINSRTGLIIDPYFSATKIQWLFDKIPRVKELAEKNRLFFGTVDSWILWNLSGRKIHATDITNASRTLLYNIHNHEWDPDLLEIFDVPSHILPEVKLSSTVYGETDPYLTGGKKIPISGIAGDQQASLYGQKCWNAGEAKCTYGTGAFVVMNIGNTHTDSPEGLLTTIACQGDGSPCYALEGSIFSAGASIEWLRNKLGILSKPEDVNILATSIDDNGGVYFVPAFTGLGAPHWNPQAKAIIHGLTQSTGKEHIARAVLEAMAYQTQEVIHVMEADANVSLAEFRVDGGVTRSSFVMQFIADILDMPTVRTKDPNITAKGAAYLAGLATGFWSDEGTILSLQEQTETFTPTMSKCTRQSLLAEWSQTMKVFHS